MITKKDYCDYETAWELCSLGYPEEDWCLLYSAQKWLREEKQVEVIVLSRGMIGAPYYFQVYTEDYVSVDDKDYTSYEDALSEGIKEAVKILKEK